MNYFVGIDISKDKFDCLWLKDTESLKVKTRVFENRPAGFKQLRGWLEKNISVDLSDIYVCMEATGIYHEALAYALYDMGVNVSVVNPAQVRDFAKGLGVQNKTDKKDSLVLARYVALTQPRLWEPEAEEIRTLKALLSRLSALEADRLRELNRLEKAEIAQGTKAVIGSIQYMIEQLEKERARLEQQIDDHIDKHPQLKQDKELLLSIPAVGKVLSREMLCVLRSRRFESASQVAAYMGVVPKLHESGTLKGRTSLSKKGPARLRAKLYMAAVVATQYNPDIKDQYERLVKAGKTKMQALGAAMRKLAQICFGVLKHQNEYRHQVA